jgi:membrane protein YdbS with pleckstrin-like domain
MTESTSFLGRWWAKQHGRQYAITAVTSGASGLLLVACAYQLLFLQDHAEWNDFTGIAITGAVVSLILFLVAFPEFLRFKGHVAMLEEVMAIQSTSELRRRKADGVLAAEALGAGHLDHWNAFLESKGLRR